MTAIPGEWIVQGGAVTVLAFVALLVYLGQLVPKRVVSQVERDRDYWRTVALKALGQSDALLPGAQIAAQVTKALGDVTADAVERALGGGSS